MSYKIKIDETLFQSFDFADVEAGILKVSEKYFKYWLFESLKGQGIDTREISYDPIMLVDDFKKGFVQIVVNFWNSLKRQDESPAKKRDLLLLPLGGYLDRTWSERYLLPIGKNSKRDPFLSFSLPVYFSSLGICNFIEKNWKKFPKPKPQPIRKIRRFLLIRSCRIKYFLKYGIWPQWIR